MKRYFICENSSCDNEITTNDGTQPNCCSGCDSGFIELFVCNACSEAGGADRAVLHAKPMCADPTPSPTGGKS